MIVTVSPPGGYSCFGDKPIVCVRGGTVLSFDKVNALAEDTLKNSPLTFLPGESQPKQLTHAELQPHLRDKRARWAQALRSKAETIRKSMI